MFHLTGGGRLSAELTGFSAGAFQVKLADESSTNISAAAVRGVDFEHGHVSAKIETAAHESLAGKVWLVDKQRFNIEGADGATKYVPFSDVVTASFVYNASTIKPSPAPPRVATTDAHDEVKRPASEPDISIITHGNRVNIPQQLAHGKVTIVDFYATWCAPCRQISPVLERIAREDADIAIRKVDIVRWGSPVAEQFNVNAVPRLHVYGADGNLVRTLLGFREEELHAAIETAKASLR